MKVKYNKYEEPYDPELGDYYYDLTCGGYCSPDKYLENQEDIDAVINAVKVLEDYRQSLQDQADQYYVEVEEGFNEEE